ncbi:MAG: hypothetical protein ACOCRK_05530 [bacterium]
MKIVFRDGKEFKGEDYEEVVNKLKKIDATQPNTVDEYMGNAAKRYSYIDIEVDISSPKEFIESLKRQNILELIKDG